MSFYRKCPYCKSNLDPNEVCDCEKRRGSTQKADIAEMIEKVCKPPKE